MLILHVNIHVRPECVDAFREATIENARNSNREPGIARFDLLQLQDEPNRFSLLEVYRTEDAVAAHKQTPHYAKWVEATADMFAEPRTRSWYTTVFPGDESW
ncbi:MAG: antibiotic biosynthesis monooxygenase [Acidobacteriota bacterium]|nr:antibiotic biosynthesis monooxygenase [Acidobacteriota bacterium]